MKRLPNWEIRLQQTVEAHRETPFQWGKHDCCHFSALCVEAITGKNPLAGFQAKYRNKESARKVLKGKGNGTLLKTLTALFGKHIHPSKAKRGDLVFHYGKTGPSVGVCLGRVSAFVGEDNDRPGLVFLPTLSMTKAFKI